MIKIGVWGYDSKGMVIFECLIEDDGDELHFYPIKNNMFFIQRIRNLYKRSVEINSFKQKLNDILDVVMYLKNNDAPIDYKMLPLEDDWSE